MSDFDENAASNRKDDQRLPKTERLRLGCEFRKVKENGRRLQGTCLVLYVMGMSTAANANNEEPTADQTTARSVTHRVGFVVSRGLGSAVARNRVRRLLREAWRLNKCHVKSHLQVVIVARQAIRGKSLQEIESELLKLLQLAGATIPS